MSRNILARVVCRNARVALLAALVGALAGVGALPLSAIPVAAQITTPTPIRLDIRVETVNQDDVLLPNADPSGFSVGVACDGNPGRGPNGAIGGTTGTNGVTLTATIPPPAATVACTMAVNPRDSYTFVSMTVTGSEVTTFGNGGRFSVPLPPPGPVSVLVRVRRTSTNGEVVVRKRLVLPDGSTVNLANAGTASGYVFTLQSGGTSLPMPPTDRDGVTRATVAPGNYTISEAPVTGSAFQGVTLNGNTVLSFSVGANDSIALVATNRVAGAATIRFTKQVVDNATPPAPVANADRSGFVFNVAGPNGFTTTVTTDATGSALLSNMGPGSYTVTEQARAGFTIVSTVVAGIPTNNPATFTIPNDPTASMLIVSQSRAATTATPPTGTTGTTTTEQLVVGCNLVVLTWPAGTELRVVVGAVTGELVTIWMYDNAAAAFRGFSPAPGAEVANNFRAVERSLQPVYLCMRTAGALVRPNP